MLLSFSKIDCYMRCPLSFKFRYIDGIEPEKTSSALVFGSAMHSTIAHFYRRLMDGERLDESELHDAFIEDWSIRQTVPIKFNGKGPLELEKQGLELVAKYVESIDGDITVPVAVEDEIRTPLINLQTGEILEGVEVHGFLDRINADGTPVELKTSSRSWSQFQADTSLQMSLYCYLAAQCDGRTKVDGRFEVLVKTKSPKLQRLETERTPNDFGQLFRIIEKVVQCIDQKLFFPYKSFNCPTCDYLMNCNAW